MSHYNMTPGQKKYLKKKYAEEAEEEKDIREWDTPLDQSNGISGLKAAQEAARKERDEWKRRSLKSTSSESTGSDIQNT